MCAWYVWGMCVCVGIDVCKYVCVCMLSPFSCVQLCVTLQTRVHAKSLQSYLTPSDPVNRSLPGSSVCGILQARILKWVAVPFSRGSSQPRDWTCVFCIAGRFFTHWATWEAQSPCSAARKSTAMWSLHTARKSSPSPLITTRESPCPAMKIQHSPK